MVKQAVQFDESMTLRPDIYSAGVVIFDTEKRVLLVKENHGAAKGLWHIPAGKVEDETPEAAATREAFEETGLTVRLVQFLNAYVGRFPSGDMIVRLVWLAQVLEDKTPSPKFTEEIAECRYFNQAEFDALCESRRIRMHHTKLMVEEAWKTLFKKIEQPTGKTALLNSK